MRLTLGLQVLIAVIAGVFVGLFLGPLVSVLRPISVIYNMLLQMVVLPYICLSIIGGLGSLQVVQAKLLFKNSWHFWLLLWGFVFFLIFLFAYLIPKPSAVFLFQSGHIFSVNESLIKNILTTLIPQNSLYDFANNIVPSIAIFGIIAGIALMLIEKKEPLLSAVERSNQVIEKILFGLAVVSPIGVFAHIAQGAGSIRISELQQIDFYLISFIVITLFLTFWILPLILSSLTPLRFREIFDAFHMVCLLPFVTGVPTISIPFINIYMKKIEIKYAWGSEQSFRSSAQTIVPISYSFVQIGNCLLLFFILFASFYYRHPFSGLEKILLSFLTIPLSIGSSVTSINAVSFLFNELNFPDTALLLFTTTMSFTMNFQILLSVTGVLTFIILVQFAHFKMLKVSWKKIITLIASLVMASAIIFAISPYVHLKDKYRNLYINQEMNEGAHIPENVKIYQTNEKLPELTRIGSEDVFSHILRTGVLKVGYSVGNMPFAYINSSNQLVGFDIAMAYELAQDLHCRLELIPVDIDHLVEHINDGLYDIAMGAILMTEDRIAQMSYSNTYIDQDYVLIIPENRRSKLNSIHEIDTKGIVVGAVGAYREVIPHNFPQATAYAGTDEKGIEMDKADVWVSSRIQAAVWCFSNPDYYIEDFGGRLGKCFLAYPIQSEAVSFLRFINNWIDIKNIDGFTKEQNDYWILGEAFPKTEEPRWSILRNVLHWIR